MEFEVLSSEKLLGGRVFDVFQESVRYPDGRIVNIQFLKHNGAVTILPVDEAGQIWFVRQYRHPSGGLLLELPAGTLELDEAPETTALRELREEIGMGAWDLQKLGTFFLAPGYSSECMHCFLARGLYPSPLTQDQSEYIQLEHYPIKVVYQMVVRGKIEDAKTLAVLAMAQSILIAEL